MQQLTKVKINKNDGFVFKSTANRIQNVSNEKKVRREHCVDRGMFASAGTFGPYKEHAFSLINSSLTV